MGVLLPGLLLVGCANSMHDQKKVEAAIVDRLQTKSGLDLKALDVQTTNVSFDKNKAYATVSFHPKDDARVNSGMVMKYTLEDQGGKWVVVKVGDGQGHGTLPPGGAGRTSLPAGHPAIQGNEPHAAANGHQQ